MLNPQPHNHASNHTNQQGHSLFLSQLPVHLQKINTIWNKLVYVGWVEATFNNLDKSLLKLISISEQHNYFDLYYQTLDIHRIFSDILNQRRAPNTQEFIKIQKLINTLCEHKTIETITSIEHIHTITQYKIALVITDNNPDIIRQIFKDYSRFQLNIFHSMDDLKTQLVTTQFDLVLVYLDSQLKIVNGDNGKSIPTLISQIKSHCPHVIAIHSRTDTHIRLKSIRHQFSDFLKTPLHENQLISIIQSPTDNTAHINVVGLFNHAKQTQSLCALMQSRKINLHCCATPLEIIHDCIEKQAQVILLFDIEQTITFELIELIQSHPKTCLIPIYYASTKSNNPINKELIKYAVHNMQDCAKQFDHLTNKLYILGKRQIHLTQHIQLAQDTQNAKELKPKIVSTEEFLNEYEYITTHLNIEPKKSSYYCFNIEIQYHSNDKPMEHIGFSQKQKLSNITNNALEDLLLNNDMACKNGVFDYLLIKEIIDEQHAMTELNDLSVKLSNLSFSAKPFDLKLNFKCVGLKIDHTRTLDSVIDFTQCVLDETTDSDASIKIMQFSNTKTMTQKEKTQTAPDHTQEHIESQESKAEVLKAFKQNGIFMKYQPIVDVQQNLAVFEAYARLCDNNNVCFDPGVFFPIITQQGLAHEFNRKIIEKALTELSSHNKISQEADLILKLLPSSNTEEDNLNKILPWFSNQLTLHRLMGRNRIIFELSEPWVIQHFEQARAFTETVKKMNCSVCIDHCDLNETTVKVLSILQPSYIKIDPSIKNQLVNAPTSLQQKVIQHLIANKVHIVASCVETKKEFTALWDNGIRYFQGYYVQQPMDQPDFLKHN